MGERPIVGAREASRMHKPLDTSSDCEVESPVFLVVKETRARTHSMESMRYLVKRILR